MNGGSGGKAAVFENAAFGKIRIVMREGQPWFVAKDVCEILGLENNRQACAELDEDEKSYVTINDGSSNGVQQNRTFLIVSESGLYALIFKSRKPEAKAFRKWVRSEVLPALRKTGTYSLPPATPEIADVKVKRIRQSRTNPYLHDMQCVAQVIICV